MSPVGHTRGQSRFLQRRLDCEISAGSKVVRPGSLARVACYRLRAESRAMMKRREAVKTSSGSRDRVESRDD